MTQHNGIACQAVSHPFGLSAATVWLADGCQPQHEGTVKMNIVPCTFGPEQTG